MYETTEMTRAYTETKLVLSSAVSRVPPTICLTCPLCRSMQGRKTLILADYGWDQTCVSQWQRRGAAASRTEVCVVGAPRALGGGGAQKTSSDAGRDEPVALCRLHRATACVHPSLDCTEETGLAATASPPRQPPARPPHLPTSTSPSTRRDRSPCRTKAMRLPLYVQPAALGHAQRSQASADPQERERGGSRPGAKDALEHLASALRKAHPLTASLPLQEYKIWKKKCDLLLRRFFKRMG